MIIESPPECLTAKTGVRCKMVVPLIYKRSGEDDDPMDPFNVPDVSKGVANQYNSAASQNLSGKGFGKNPGELYDWNEVTAPQSTSSMPSLSNTASRVGTQLGVGTLSAFTGVPSLGINAVVDFLDAKDRFSLDNVGALVSKAGIAALGLTGFPGMIAGAVASQIDPASQQTRDRNLGVYNTSFLGRALRSPVPNTFQHAFFGQRDIEDRTLNTEYEDIEGVKGTTWDDWETSMDGPGGTPDPNSYDTISTSTLGLDALDETDKNEPDSYGEAETEDDYDDYDDDYFAGGGYVGYEHGGMHLSPEREDERLKEIYGGGASLTQTPNYFEKITPRTRNQSVTIPPTSIGNIDVGITLLKQEERRIITDIPKKIMELENLKGQERVDTKRAELKGIFKITETPDFMANTLIDPKEIRASRATTEQEVIDAAGEKIKENQKEWAAGITLALSPENLNAIVNADYADRGRFRNLRGDVRIPLSDDTSVNLGAQRNLIEGGPDSTSYNAGLNTVVSDDYNVNLGAQRNLIEGGPDSTSFNAGLNTPVFDGIGNLGINYRRTPGDNYIGGQVTIPLGGT